MKLWLLTTALAAVVFLFGSGCSNAPPTPRDEPESAVGKASSPLTILDLAPSDTSIGPLGYAPNDAATVGQTFTAGTSDVILESFAFGTELPSTLVGRALVYEWGGVRPAGPALYESANTPVPANGELPVFQTGPGGVVLEPLKKYVLLLTTLGAPGTGSGSMLVSTGNRYPAGEIVGTTAGSTAEWSTSTWRTAPTDQDLTFSARLVSVGSTPSSTACALSANTAVPGQRVTATARVTSSQGTPRGYVVFLNRTGAEYGRARLDDAGQVSFLLPALTPGTYGVVASYRGSSIHAPSAAALTNLVVSRHVTTVRFSSSSNPSLAGRPVSLTASVTASTAPGQSPTGTVSFTENGVAIGTGAVQTDGTAVLTTSDLTAGTHRIVATYGGDDTFAPGSSPVLAQAVNRDGTTLTLVSSPSPSTFGALVAFTVRATSTTSGSSSVPTGAVVVRENGVTLATVQLDAGGSGSFTTSALAPGTRTVTASYAGDAQHGAATASVAHVVNAAATLTTLTSAVSRTVTGQAVTFTATVTGPGATPGGTARFLDGSTVLGTGTLDASGKASFTTSALVVASHSITATYLGSSRHLASVSSALQHEVQQASTTTTLASSASPAPVGSAVTLTATVRAVAPGAGTPSGVVTFRRGTAALDTVALAADGTARFTTTALTLGTLVLEATYRGDSSFRASTSAPLSQSIEPSGVTAALSSSLNPSIFGRAVTFTASFTSAVASEVPTGVVSFQDGDVEVGTALLSDTGIARFTTSTLEVGTHTIRAVYGGDTTHAGPVTATLSQTVGAAATTTTVTSSANPSVFGQAVSFAAQVTSGASGAFTGSVTFTAGVETLGTVDVGEEGRATFTTSALTVATYAIVATYSGGARFAASVAPAISQLVNPSPTTTTLTASQDPVPAGTPVTFSATVSAPGESTPTGTVTFEDGSTELGTGTLDARGVATFTTSTLTGGPHVITAEYVGDGSFAASTSSPLDAHIGATATTVTLTVAPDAARYGTDVEATVTVTSPEGTPRGTFVVRDGTRVLASGALDATTGDATFVLENLAAGTHTLTGEYTGDGTHPPGSASATVTVRRALTTTTLTSSSDRAKVGEAVRFTATVASSPAAREVVGELEFLDGPRSLGKVTLASGSASFTTSGLAWGIHSITAAYAGSANFEESASEVLPQTMTGIVAPQSDAGAPEPDGGTKPVSPDGGGPGGFDAPAGDCGCRVASRHREPAALLSALALVGLAMMRRRGAH